MIFGIGHSEGPVWEAEPGSHEDRVWTALARGSRNIATARRGTPKRRETRAPVIADDRHRATRELPAPAGTREVRYVAAGTRREIDEIRDYFDAEQRAEITSAEHVNEIWNEVGIQFRLVAIVDQGLPAFQSLAIDSDRVGSVVRGLNSPQVVNVYFFRDLIGALGTAGSSPSPRQDMRWNVPFAAIEDWEQSGTTWSSSVRILSHELGHLLNLPHLEDIDNLMYPWNTATAREFIPIQTVLSRHHAGQYKASIHKLCAMDTVFRERFTDPEAPPLTVNAQVHGRLIFGADED